MDKQSKLNYKYLKLSNGENILCMTDDDCENLTKKKFIHILEPVLITPFRFPRGVKIMETFIMQPWVPFASEKFFTISTSSIIMATNVHDDFKDQYEKYIEVAEAKGEPDISNLEKDDENFLIDAREQEEDEFDTTYYKTRTIH